MGRKNKTNGAARPAPPITQAQSLYSIAVELHNLRLLLTPVAEAYLKVAKAQLASQEVNEKAREGAEGLLERVIGPLAQRVMDDMDRPARVEVTPAGVGSLTAGAEE